MYSTVRMHGVTEEPSLGMCLHLQGETLRQGLTQFCVGFSLCEENEQGGNACLVRKGTSELRSPF